MTETMPAIPKLIICPDCGNKVKIENENGNEKASCDGKQCKYEITMLGGKKFERYICLGDDCRGNTIMIVPPHKIVEKCSKCESKEIYQMEESSPSFFFVKTSHPNFNVAL